MANKTKRELSLNSLVRAFENAIDSERIDDLRALCAEHHPRTVWGKFWEHRVENRFFSEFVTNAENKMALHCVRVTRQGLRTPRTRQMEVLMRELYDAPIPGEP